MDEAAWQRCRDPGMMLQCVRGKASDRKLRLFACACWRVIAGPVRPIVELAERLADDPKAYTAATNLRLTKDERTLLNNAWEAARDATSWRPDVARQAVRHQSKTLQVDTNTCWEAWTVAQREWASLVREIFGSPYQQVQVSREWPLTVTELANAIYQGQDCAFALHDALTEVGQTELAEHFAASQSHPRAGGPLATRLEAMAAEQFAQPQWHPKGCWAVDLILAKG